MEGSNPLTMTEWQQPLYLIKWEHIPQSHQNGHALISDHVRTHPTVISEWPLVLDCVEIEPSDRTITLTTIINYTCKITHKRD